MNKLPSSSSKISFIPSLFIEEEDGKWYFWNEYWSEKYGPYKSKEEVTSECSKYFHYL